MLSTFIVMMPFIKELWLLASMTPEIHSILGNIINSVIEDNFKYLQFNSFPEPIRAQNIFKLSPDLFYILVHK